MFFFSKSKLLHVQTVQLKGSCYFKNFKAVTSLIIILTIVTFTSLPHSDSNITAL